MDTSTATWQELIEQGFIVKVALHDFKAVSTELIRKFSFNHCGRRTIYNRDRVALHKKPPYEMGSYKSCSTKHKIVFLVVHCGFLTY